VKLIPAQFVKPFVKSNKNDFIDAEAIAEAVDRQNMRFVPIKTDDQLDLQALHRVRERLMIRRTSVINQIRSFLLERGIVFEKSPIRLREAIPEVLENANENLTPRMRNLVEMLWNEWKGLELQIAEMNDEECISQGRLLLDEIVENHLVQSIMVDMIHLAGLDCIVPPCS